MESIHLRVMFVLLILAVPFGAFAGNGMDTAPANPSITECQPPGHMQPGADGLHDSVRTENEGGEVSKGFFVTLDEYVRMVMRNNNDLAAQYLEYKTYEAAAQGEKGTFEPELSTSYQSAEDRVRYSVEDKSSMLFAQERDASSSDFNASVQMVAPTGTNLRVIHATRKYKDRAQNEDYQYKSSVAVEVIQPLLKGAGTAAVAQLGAALAASDEAFHTYRLKRLDLGKRALIACWDLYGATGKLRIREQSVRIARELYGNNKKRADVGRMAETEVLVAEAGLHKRMAYENRARQEVNAAMEAVRTFIAFEQGMALLAIDFSRETELSVDRPTFAESMRNALAHRPEYHALRSRIKKEEILLAFAENQRWPQVDLKGSYGLNGLGESAGDSSEDAFHDNYRTWNVGVYFTVPLQGGIKTRSNLSIAQMNKRKALFELKGLEVEIGNRVGTTTSEVNSAYRQLDYLSKSCQTNQRLMDMALTRFHAGRSNSDDVLNREEDYIESQEAELDGFVYLKKSLIELDSTEGDLLVQYNIDDPVTTGSMN